MRPASQWAEPTRTPWKDGRTHAQQERRTSQQQQQQRLTKPSSQQPLTVIRYCRSGDNTEHQNKANSMNQANDVLSLQNVHLKTMVDMVPISSVVSDYDKLRMTSEGHNIGEQQQEEREGAAPPAANEADDMEDGEICEDDDEDIKPLPVPVAPAAPSRSSLSSKDTRPSRTSHGPQTALSSWSGTVNARAQAAAGNRSPLGDSSCFDPNEEYYRSGGNEDRDYRYLDDNQQIIQDFSNESDHRSPSSPSRYDSKRRRRSVTPEEYRHGSKRARAVSPPYHRNSRRAPLGRGRWAERQICKFFREGYCRDGDNCNYSHDASDSMRKSELCKFYQHGYCKKGLQCPLLHGEFPCKAFHKGECSKEQCQYSHVALNEYTQGIFDQLMKDEELASKILIPQAPVKRKVLLPAGPIEPPRSAPEQHVAPMVPMDFVPHPQHATVVHEPSTSIIPPSAEPIPMAAPVAIPIVSMPAEPIQAVQTPAMSDMLGMYAPIAPQVIQLEVTQPPTMVAPHPEPRNTNEATEQDTAPGGFNINEMLAQITQGTAADTYSSYAPQPQAADNFAAYAPQDDPFVPQEEPYKPMPGPDESPASPTQNVEPVDLASAPDWKLIPVEVIKEDNTQFEEKLIRMSQTNAGLRMDPRLKKLLENQFDRVSTLIGSMAAQNTTGAEAKPQSAANTAQSAPAPAPARTDPRIDPRRADPRKRPAAAPAAAPVATPTAAPAEASASPSSSASDLRVVYDANQDQHALVHGYVDRNDPSTWSTDVDHRPNFNQYGNSPPQSYHSHERERDRHYNGSSYREDYRDSGPGSYRSSYRGGGEGRYRGRGRGHWNRDRPPRDSRFYRHDYEEEEPRGRRNGVHPSSSSVPVSTAEAPQPAPEQPAAPAQPMSLREKRKDNVYESPLSRPPGGARF
uniref:Zinc finger CCCH domain-containing protein 6 n=1 Tax=Steinernema glaseri TaxID=37863 RepID=A0A1I8AA52_9BILA